MYQIFKPLSPSVAFLLFISEFYIILVQRLTLAATLTRYRVNEILEVSLVAYQEHVQSSLGKGR